MEERTIKSAIISTDPALRELLRKVLAADDLGITVGLEVIVPFPEINDSNLEQLRQLGPDLIFLDVSDDPIMGLKFAQFLIEGAPNRRIIGLGEPLSQDLLLQAMQAGVSEYLPKPVDEAKVQGAIDRIARKFGHRVEERRREPGKLLAFFSPKGGAGSTCVATNTAISLHRITRGKVLLVDLDLELGETALLLGVEPRFSLLYSMGVAQERISLPRFVELVATNPARIFGLFPQKGTLLPGADADIVLFDPTAKWTMGQAASHSCNDWHAYEGIEITGKIHKVYSRGELIIDGENCLAEKGRGHYLHRRLP